MTTSTIDPHEIPQVGILPAAEEINHQFSPICQKLQYQL
jgi:hypothetical protein